MNLVVISHTRHFITDGGIAVGWGPTVRELDELGNHFQHIYHLAYGYEGIPSAAFLPYRLNNVEFVRLFPAGGHTLRDKINILLKMPANLRIIASYVRKADAVQVRVPTALGLYVLPWISWFSNRSRFKMWVKYAGNWIQKDAPLSYRLQRWFIRNNFQRSKVTLNGAWEKMPGHCLTFENPCLTNQELEVGSQMGSKKDFGRPLTAIFVGRVERAKGIERLISAVAHLRRGLISEVIVVGEGELDRYKKLAQESNVVATFKGGLSRSEINNLYAVSHLLILASDASEGFPKVIAEAACFGCVPIVSDVSAIKQYVNDRNGIVLQDIDPRAIASEIELLLKDRIALKEKSIQAMKMAPRFSYDHYVDRIVKEVLVDRPI